MKPLFIPLKKTYYEQFRDGTKPGMCEYRMYGSRWNQETCKIGRPVVLSCGYGKHHPRLHGVIRRFRKSMTPCFTKAWIDCYGEGKGSCGVYHN